MSYKHGAFPCTNAQFSLVTSFLFQSYFAAGIFGFVVWGKNLAKVS
jgi:hypothetical protein